MASRPLPIPFPIEDPERSREQVLAAARQLAGRLVATRPNPPPPPFDPAAYAELLGIRVRYTRSPEAWDALLAPVGERPLILCNLERGSRRRRRFSLAHEVAHALFANPAAVVQLRARVGERSPAAVALERLADVGAAELLMPRPWFDEVLDFLGLRAAAVVALADSFQVSLAAAALRVTEVAAAPVAVALLALSRPPSGQGAVAYRVLTGATFRSPGFPLLLPPGKSVPTESVIHRCSLQQGEMGAEEELALGRETRRVHVTAFPLHRGHGVESPPTVCAVLGRPER